MILDVIFCALWCVGILALVWGLAGWLLLPLSVGKTALSVANLLPEAEPTAVMQTAAADECMAACGRA